MSLTDEQLKEFLDGVKRDEFAAQLNTKFRVDKNFEAELIGVSEPKPYPRQESFTLLFLMPGDFPPVQGNYLFEHPALGEHVIFVVPVEHASDGIVFEAVFNRLLPRQS